MVLTSGRPRMAMATKQMEAMTTATGRLRSGQTILIAIESKRPAAAAAKPANICSTRGSLLNWS